MKQQLDSSTRTALRAISAAPKHENAKTSTRARACVRIAYTGVYVVYMPRRSRHQHARVRRQSTHGQNVCGRTPSPPTSCYRVVKKSSRVSALSVHVCSPSKTNSRRAEIVKRLLVFKPPLTHTNTHTRVGSDAWHASSRTSCAACLSRARKVAIFRDLLVIYGKDNCSLFENRVKVDGITFAICAHSFF